MSTGWPRLSELVALLDDERSTADLRTYFTATPEWFFTGSRFESLGYGNQVLHRDVVTAEDLIAVEMLNARVPAPVALELLEGGLGHQISDELRAIPTALDLSDEKAKPYIEDGGPADRAWHLLAARQGVGKAIAGKLLARKRPRLIPVYDDVVACALRGRRGFWLWLHEQLRADDLLLTRKLRELRTNAAIPGLVSDVRVLDVVLWMRHRRHHRPHNCPGLSCTPVR
ncbi:DUF6308 family protein [Micromonospora echinospora]